MRVSFCHMCLCAIRIRAPVEKAMLVGVRLTSFKTAVADQPPSLFCCWLHHAVRYEGITTLRTDGVLKSLNDPVAALFRLLASIRNTSSTS